eukprot:21653-Chlamydomonas_euryale.AAC.1
MNQRASRAACATSPRPFTTAVRCRLHYDMGQCHAAGSIRGAGRKMWAAERGGEGRRGAARWRGTAEGLCRSTDLYVARRDSRGGGDGGRGGVGCSGGDGGAG